VVWRASERHVLKAQYAEGFRAPTFFELYRTGGAVNDLDFETVATGELNWVYSLPGTTLRTTLFHSDLDDMIFIVRGTPFFRNYVDAQTEGVEVEVEREVTSALKLVANVSFADTEDGRVAVPPDDSPSFTEPDLLGNLALLYRPAPSSVVGGRWNHVGDREAPGDDEYDIVELTYTHADLFAEGLSLRAGLDDALDEQQVSVRPNPFGVQLLRFPGRRLWLELEWAR
jgi:outer membrane receptor for ferrienterochelin and colicins